MLRPLRQFLAFFVYSNLFIAGCAVVMVDQTYRFLLQSPVNIYLLFFVLFSTLCSYSFHWYLTSHSVLPSPRIKWLEKYRIIHVVLFIVGLTGSGILFMYLLPYWHWLLIGAIITFFYSAPKLPHRYFKILRKVALGKTIFLALVWMYVTTILPVLISDREWNTSYVLFAVSRYFQIYAICILFDLRDREDDKADGIRSLITYLDEKGIFYLFTFSIIIFGICTLLLYRYDYKITDIIILLIPGLLTAA
ncbi:MAG TPA: UbiA family prenyltransferase, partial [Chitinophagaceae bacterium]